MEGPIMSLKKLFSFIPKWLLFLLFITLLVSSFEGVVNSAIIGYLPVFNQKSSVTEFIKFVIVSVIAYIIIYSSVWLFSKIQNKIVYIINIKLKAEYIEKATFQRIDTNKEISTLINDFKLIETNYFTLIVQIISDICMSLVSTLFILKLNFLLGIVFILFAIPQVFIPNIYQSFLTKRSTTWSKNNSEFVKKLRDLMGGRDILLRYHAFTPAYKKIKQQLFLTEASYQALNDSKISAKLVSWLWSLISLFVPISVGFYLMVNHQGITAATILAIYLASNQVMMPLREAIDDFASVKTTSSLRQEIENIFEKGSKLDSHNKTVADKPAVLQQILGKQLSFSFGNKQILKNTSFTIKHNDKILLTGASGMGKSTIFNLLMGTLLPTDGQLIYQVNGQYQNQTDPNMFALIQQDPYIFNETIRFNLGLGLNFSDDILFNSLKEVGLDQELGNAPLDYLCENGGSNLSGGQRARLEIARALVFNRQVILADEIDANLDPQNVLQIENLLTNINKTVIMISHHMDSKHAKQLKLQHWNLDNGKLDIENY